MSTYLVLRCDCENLCKRNGMTEPDCEICDQLNKIIKLNNFYCLGLSNSKIRIYTSKYEEIKKMYLAGFIYQEIRKKFNLKSDGTIVHVLNRFNLPRRVKEYHILNFMW